MLAEHEARVQRVRSRVRKATPCLTNNFFITTESP